MLTVRRASLALADFHDGRTGKIFAAVARRSLCAMPHALKNAVFHSLAAARGVALEQRREIMLVLAVWMVGFLQISIYRYHICNISILIFVFDICI